MWDITVVERLTKYDTSQSAAGREVFEEIGLKLDLKNINPHITINFRNGFDDVYIIEEAIDVNEL